MSEGSSPPDTTLRADIAGWVLLGAIAIVGLCLAFVHAPLRLKLPLISPMVVGVVAGWGLGRWAIARNVFNPRLVGGAAAFLLLLGQLGIAAETYRIGVKPIRVELNRIRLERDPFADEIEQALAQASDNEEERLRLQAEHQDARRRRAEELARVERQATFPGYLEQRIPKAWGRWPPPWPEVFWGAEVVVASLLAGWMASRVIRTQAPTPGVADRGL